MRSKWFLISPVFKKPPSNIFLYVLCAKIFLSSRALFLVACPVAAIIYCGSSMCFVKCKTGKYNYSMLFCVQLTCSKSINGTREEIFGQFSMQKIHNRLLEEHCTQTLQLDRDKAAKSACFNFHKLLYGPASVCDKYVFGVSRLRGCSTKKLSTRSF